MSEASRLHLASANLRITDDDLSSFVALFAYAGFNPEMVHDHFFKICKQKDISQDTFLADLRAIIVLGAMKGNYSIKNSVKISDDGKTKADSLYGTYQMKKGSVGLDKKAVTLPRVLSAFPEITAKVVLRCPDKNFGTKTNGLSKLIKSPVFAAIIPATLDKKVKGYFLDLYNIYSAEQTQAISKISSFAEALLKQEEYTNIAHKSVVPAETTRVNFFLSAEEMLTRDVTFGNTIPEMNTKITTEELATALTSLRSSSGGL